MKRDQGGQATVEFALVIPLIAMMLLLIVQAAVVVREQVMLINGVREAARAAAVDPSADISGIARSASGIASMSVSSSNDGTNITVTGTAEVPIVVPFLKSIRSSVGIDARATFRSETASAGPSRGSTPGSNPGSFRQHGGKQPPRTMLVEWVVSVAALR